MTNPSQGNVPSQVASFLAAKGLTGAQIAGVLGNLQVESSFNTGSTNPREGAIGLAQWEGGRRTALQQYAAAHGTTETDLNAQLGYMWQELTTTDSGALAALKATTTPEAAAAAWDSQYERSDGRSRATRVQDAEQFSSNGTAATAAGSAPLANSAGDPAIPLGTSGTSAVPAAAPVKETSAQRKADLISGTGQFADLLTQIPELNKALNTAVSKGMSAAEFQNLIDNTSWYRQNSDTVKSTVALQASNPAEYTRQLGQTQDSVALLAKQSGFNLTPQQEQQIARNAILTGTTGNSAELMKAVSGTQDFRKLKSTNGLSGAMASTTEQLQQLATSYGQSWTASTLAGRAQNVINGTAKVEDYQAQLQHQAKVMYPGLANQLDAGSTVLDVAKPYQQAIGNLLEKDPDQIQLTDPMMQQSLQGSDANGHQPLAIWQTENLARQQPSWQYTDNSKQTTATALTKIGSDFGFSA